jgi:hypothetical protein
MGLQKKYFKGRNGNFCAISAGALSGTLGRPTRKMESTVKYIFIN